MRVLIDGDACPNKREIKQLLDRYQIRMIVFVDYAHLLNEDPYEVRHCEVGKDSVDMRIVNEVKAGDLVITQDYGLASLVLSKNAKVLHVSGMRIDQENIDGLLLKRYEGYKQRKRDKHLNGPKKRTKQDEDYFLNQVLKIVEGEKEMKKYIFFDIDGTLTNHNPGGIILPSTYRTLEKLKENGHFVAIATGRSYQMAKDVMKEAHIDNAVCCGGNGLVIDGKVVYINPLEKDKAFEVIQECLDKDILFGIQKDDSFDIYTHRQDFTEQCPEVNNFANVIYMNNDDYYQFTDIYKIYIGIKRGENNPLLSLKTTGLHYARYHDDSIIVEPDDKYKGIVDMIHHLDGKEEDIVVFGDGHNDLSMMKQAAIGIAMGNAIDELKEIATFVTKGCNEDGIEYACQHYGWI